MKEGKKNRRQFLSEMAFSVAGASLGALGLEGCSHKRPAQETGRTLHTYDLTYTLKLNPANARDARKIYDHSYLVSSLQGIVNRDSPRLYVYLMGPESATPDMFWLRELPAGIPTLDHFWLQYLRNEDKWLAGYRLEPLSDIDTLLRQFRSEIRGLVVYDEKVPATSNVASTVAGVEDLLSVRYDPSADSLYRWLTGSRGPKLPVKVWLIRQDGSSLFTGKGVIPGSKTPSTGSAKCDAYIWAKENYLDTGRSNPLNMGYYLDAWWLHTPQGYIPDHKLSNHDYFIAQRGFFFDLSPWGDEAPNDDPHQPIGADLRTMQAILHSAWSQSKGQKMNHIGGFPPVPRKYTNKQGGRHEGVPTEWHFAEIFSCYNAYMDADIGSIADMANASVYQHYPLAPRYTQKLPSVEDLKAKGYITQDGKVAPKFYAAAYVGDYDSTGWIYQRIPDMWRDPARGSVPLGWAFNPNLSARFGPGLVYARTKSSPNDSFVAGDSGAGYVNPMNFVPPRKWSGLPSGLDVWVRHCGKYFHLWDISITGFIIDGYTPHTSGKVETAYAAFSRNGIGLQYAQGWGVVDGMPYAKVEESIQYHDPAKSAQLLLRLTGKKKPDFLYFRTILMTPSEHKKMFDQVKASPEGKDIEFVDPYTLFLLIKTHANAG